MAGTWWDTITGWWDGEDPQAAAPPAEAEAQRAQQLIARWRQQATPTAPTVSLPARDPLEEALAQMPQQPAANPWQAAVDTWRNGPPVQYDVQLAQVDYAIDGRPDTGAAPFIAPASMSPTLASQQQNYDPGLAWGRGWGVQPTQEQAPVNDAYNPLSPNSMWAQGFNEIMQTPSVERAQFDINQRETAREASANDSWGQWLQQQTGNVGEAWQGLQGALADQTMGQGNPLAVGGGVLGLVGSGVGAVTSSNRPTQWLADQAMNVASGLQATQDLVNSIPMGQGNLPLGTAISSAATAAKDALTGKAGAQLMGGTEQALQVPQTLYNDFVNSYWQQQTAYQTALRPTAEQAARTTPEERAKQQQRALLNWADPAAVAKTFDALVDQPATVNTLITDAKRLYDQGTQEQDEDLRQELWAQAADKAAEAYRLQNTHPVALVNENTNLGRQLLFELLEPDITSVVGKLFELADLTPAARRLASVAEEALQPAEQAAKQLAGLAVGPQAQAAMMAERSGYDATKLWNPASWWTTGQARAHLATDNFHRFMGNLLGDVDTVGDAKVLMRQIVTDPGKLITGMPANLFQSDGILARATQDGLIRFGSMNLNNIQEPLRIFQQAAQDFITNAESLNKSGPLLNKIDFAVELTDAMNEAGYKFFNVAAKGGGAQTSAIGKVGKTFRSIVSPMYIYLSPGTWLTNIIGGVGTALGDGTMAGGLIRNLDDHLGKLYGVDPTMRGLEGAAGAITQSGQFKPMGLMGQILDPLRKAYSGIEENMAKRVYYKSTTYALKRVGRDILNNTLTPLLTANGITNPKMIRQISDHLFEVGYQGGNLVDEFNKLLQGQTRVFSLSNVNPQWLDALSPDTMEGLYNIIRTAPDRPTALTQLQKWVGDASKYWDDLLQEAPPSPARHVWMKQEVAQDTADLAQVGNMATKYGAVPAADVDAWKKATATAMADTQRRMNTLMQVVAESQNPANRYALYNVWGTISDMTANVRAQLGQLAEAANGVAKEQKAAKWGEYWGEARRLWDERNTAVSNLLEQSAAAIAKGEEMAPNLKQWDILERTAQANEAKLWEALRLEPVSGAYDQRLAQVIDAGRQLTDRAVARAYAAARRFANVDAIDHIISAERNVQAAGSQARSYLDKVLEKALKSGKWEDYYQIRNEVWRQLRQYEKDVWGMATREIVSDGLAAETSTAIKFDAGIDGTVELIRPESVNVQKTSMLGPEKTVTQEAKTDWLVKRDDGTITRIADANVPADVKARYNGVTPDEVSAQVQTEMDNLASAHPYAEEAQQIIDAPVPSMRLVEPQAPGVKGIIRQGGKDTEVKILGKGTGDNYRYQLPDGTEAQASMDRLMITDQNGTTRSLRNVQALQNAQGDIAKVQQMAAGTQDARQAIAAEWDRVAKAKGGFLNIDAAIRSYTRNGIVSVPENKFEDLYGATIAGRRINNQDDVNKLLQEYYNLGRKGKEAKDAAKAAGQGYQAAWNAEPVQPTTLPYSPSPEQLQAVEANVRRGIEAAAKRNNLTPGQVESYVQQALTDIAKNDIAVSVPKGVFDNILEDGRLKTQFETGTSGATLNKTQRAEAESKGLGIPEDIPAQQRPVYGYMNFGADTRNLSQRGYGDITIILSDDVRPRTTIAVGDSMAQMRENNLVGAPIDSPTVLAADHEISNLVDYARTGDAKDFAYSGVGYVEAQVQGGVTLQDVKAVLDEKSALTPEQVQRLQAQGIQVLQGDAAKVYGKLPERGAATATAQAVTRQQLDELRKQAAAANISTASETGAPNNRFLLNVINKDLGLNLTHLEDLPPARYDEALAALGKRAEAPPVAPTAALPTAAPMPVTPTKPVLQKSTAGFTAGDIKRGWQDYAYEYKAPPIDEMAAKVQAGKNPLTQKQLDAMSGLTIAGEKITDMDSVKRLVQQYIDLQKPSTFIPTPPTSSMGMGIAPMPIEAMEELIGRVKKALNLGGGANQDDLQKAAQATVKTTTSAGGTQAPELGLAAMHAKEQLNNIYQYVTANLDDIITPKGAIGQGQSLRALDDFRRTVLPAWDNAKYVASEYGNRMRSFTMVDFANNTRLDELASLFFPYSFWFTRSIKNSAERMLFEPQVWSRVMKTEKAISGMREQLGDPQRFDGAIPIDMGNGTVYYLRLSPAKYWPTFGMFTQNDYADPESANNAFSFGMESMQSANFNPFPWMQAGSQIVSNAKEGKNWLTDIYPLSYMPQGKWLGWGFSQMFGPELPWGARPTFYEYNIARELTTMVSEKAITPEEAQWTQDILRQMKFGEDPLPEQAALGDKLKSILETATRRAANKELMSAFTSWGTGISVRPFDTDERTAMQAQQAYKQREYNALTNPYGSEAAQSYTFDQYPELGPKYSQYGVMNQDSTRPGASAALSAKIDQTGAARDALYTAGNSAVDALLTANPSATKKDIYNARLQGITENASQYVDQPALAAYLQANPGASYVDVVKFVTDAIEAKYPSASMVEASNKPKQYNPVEQQENFQQATLKQADKLFPYPTYPEGGTPAQIKAYMQQKAAIDAQREQWTQQQLTTGGGQLFPNWMKGSTALDAPALATTPENAQAIMTADANKYKTELEQKRLGQIEAEQAAKSAEWAARRGAVSGYFGEGGAAMWDQYYALPKGEARKKFIQDNPVMRAINLYAYNSADIKPALEMFGDDTLGKWALAPAYADTPEAKEARQQYWDANPKAFLFHSWLNGRPSTEDETPGDEPKYNFGKDYAEAKKLFGDDIWSIVEVYKRGWNGAMKGQYYDAHPQLSKFFEWWYGLLPKKEGQGQGGGSGRSGGGGGGSYQQRERNTYVNMPSVYARELSRGLADIAPIRGYSNPQIDTSWMKSGQQLRPGAPKNWSASWIRGITKK